MMHQDLTISLLENPSTSVTFQYVPDAIQDKRQANFAKVAIPGRSNPHLHYIGGEDSLSLKLKFQSLDANAKTSVQKNVGRLKAFGHGADVVLTFGDMYHDAKVWKISSVSANYTDFDSENGYVACQAEVSMSFMLNREASFIPADNDWIDA